MEILSQLDPSSSASGNLHDSKDLACWFWFGKQVLGPLIYAKRCYITPLPPAYPIGYQKDLREYFTVVTGLTNTELQAVDVPHYFLRTIRK